jgi:hypothetical protein
MVFRCMRWLACGVVCALAMSAVYSGVAQAQPAVNTAEPLKAPSTDENAAIARTVLADPRIRAAVGEGNARVISAFGEFDKAEAEAFLKAII